MSQTMSADGLAPGVYRHSSGKPLVWFHKFDDGRWERKDLMGQPIGQEGNAAPCEDMIDALIRIA